MNEMEKKKKSKNKILKKMRYGEGESSTRLEPYYRTKISLNDIEDLKDEDLKEEHERN